MDKKQERNIVIFVIFMILLFSSIIAYTVYSRAPEEFEFQGVTGKVTFNVDKHTGNSVYYLTFYKKLSDTKLQKYVIPFNYGPDQIGEIPLEGDYREMVDGSTNVFITRDAYLDSKTNSELIVAMLTVDRIVGNDLIKPPIYNKDTTLAAIEENEASKELELPIYTCSYATKEDIVIWFKEGQENRIYSENEYCIVAEFKEGDDPKKVATKLSYHFLGLY